ncbi:MAG: hypothetical protein WCD35_00845 [Mycobacteriales bacterium]
MRIERRFCGPPDSGNGGVTAGMLAAYVDAAVVEVTLRKPPPLETELRVADGALYDGDVLVAQALPGSVDLTPPAPVDVARAAEAEKRFAGLVAHPFPTCFVCSPTREDGLRITAGPVGDGVVAATWTPVDEDPVMVWAALDCPGGWSCDLPGRPMVLGRMACRTDALPAPGERQVVMGWHLGSEGRKVRTGSALYDASGRVLAVAAATWIALS